MVYGTRWLGFWSLFILLALPISPARSQTAQPRLTVEVENSYIGPYDTTGWLTVYLTNPYDSIEGVELRIRSADTSRLQFIQGWDTTGTLVSGWRTVYATAFPGDVRLGALANFPLPFVWQYIVPSSLPRPLIRYQYKVKGARPEAALAYIHVDSSLEDFGFSDPSPNLIGLVTETVYDTVCFRCLYRDSLGCYNYEEVFEPPCDSIGFRPRYESRYDTAQIHTISGSIFLDDCCAGTRGNLSFDAADLVDLTDLSRLIGYLVVHSEALPCFNESDINGSGLIDLTDLSMLIGFLIAGAPLPACPY